MQTTNIPMIDYNCIDYGHAFIMYANFWSVLFNITGAKINGCNHLAQYLHNGLPHVYLLFRIILRVVQVHGYRLIELQISHLAIHANLFVVAYFYN